MRDDLAPLGEDEPFPCRGCSGAGVILCEDGPIRCFECGGSGYGPPPPSLETERQHCLCRLAKWAHSQCAEEK